MALDDIDNIQDPGEVTPVENPLTDDSQTQEHSAYHVPSGGDITARDKKLHLSGMYENWFLDRNDFTFMAGASEVRLNDFSISHINEYRWLDEGFTPLLYPRTPAILYSDQVVLGLPYQNMFQQQ